MLLFILSGLPALVAAINSGVSLLFTDIFGGLWLPIIEACSGTISDLVTVAIIGARLAAILCVSLIVVGPLGVTIAVSSCLSSYSIVITIFISFTLAFALALLSFAFAIAVTFAFTFTFALSFAFTFAIAVTFTSHTVISSWHVRLGLLISCVVLLFGLRFKKSEQAPIARDAGFSPRKSCEISKYSRMSWWRPIQEFVSAQVLGNGQNVGIAPVDRYGVVIQDEVHDLMQQDTLNGFDVVRYQVDAHA